MQMCSGGIFLLISLVRVDARDYRSALFQAPGRAVSLGPSLTSSFPVGTDLKAEEDREHSRNLLSYLISHKGTAGTQRDKVCLFYMYLQI